MFLTLPDPRAAVKGSRDPLGVQPVWTTFGRHIVRNLTTVTTSVRGFTIHLLGRYFAERLIEEGRAKEEDALGIFLRMEQIGAYVRHVGHGVEGDIRGIDRVQATVAECKGKVPIATTSDAVILSDQKTYGLWGLYTASARASGLCAAGPVGLTERGRSFVEPYYLPTLGKSERDLRRLLLHGGTLHTSKASGLFNSLRAALPEKLSRREKELYGAALRDAAWFESPVAPDRQATFARLLAETTDLDEWLGRADVVALSRAAKKRDEGLSIDLKKVLRLEALLAPAEALFGYLQARDEQPIANIGASVREMWGRRVPNLTQSERDAIFQEVTSIVGSELSGIMQQCDSALATGDYERAVAQLLEWNALVMKGRKAAPWVRKRDDKLEVRYRGTEQELPTKADLPELWRNSYFFDALRVITKTLGAPA